MLLALAITGALVVSLMVAFRLYSTAKGDRIPSQVTSFAVVSDSKVKIEFQVVTDPGKAATCFVRARGADGQEVGHAEVAVAASSKRSVKVTHTLSTSAKAVTGEVQGCTSRAN